MEACINFVTVPCVIPCCLKNTNGYLYTTMGYFKF